MSLWAGDPAPLMVKASSAAAVALVHSPNNVPALLVQGGFENNLMSHDMVATAKAYELARAVGTDPSVWAANKALFFDAPRGRYDEAIASLERGRGEGSAGCNAQVHTGDGQRGSRSN